MAIINSGRNLQKDIERIKNITSLIDKRLSKANLADEQKINGFTIDQLQDISKVVGLADFVLCKYEHKKEVCSILSDFTSMIKDTADDISEIDDDIAELILSAEDSIKKVKDVHSRIHQRSGFEETDPIKVEQILAETGSINLTKFTTEINTTGYQQNSEEESGQVI